MEDKRIKEILIEKDSHFKKLFLEHQNFEQELTLMRNKEMKTDEDFVVQQDLKKRKLKIKDAMQERIYQYRSKLD